MALEHCKIIDLPKISDPRGNLTFVESDKHIPFEIKRVYYLYDVPGGAERGRTATRASSNLLWRCRVALMSCWMTALTKEPIT